MKIAKATEKHWTKRTGDANAVHTNIVKSNKRQDKNKALTSKATDKGHYSVTGLTIWCSVQKKKDDIVILQKPEEVRAYKKTLKDREPLPIIHFLLKIEYYKGLEVVDYTSVQRQ